MRSCRNPQVELGEILVSMQPGVATNMSSCPPHSRKTGPITDKWRGGSIESHVRRILAQLTMIKLKT